MLYCTWFTRLDSKQSNTLALYAFLWQLNYMHSFHNTTRTHGVGTKTIQPNMTRQFYKFLWQYKIAVWAIMSGYCRSGHILNMAWTTNNVVLSRVLVIYVSGFVFDIQKSAGALTPHCQVHLSAMMSEEVVWTGLPTIHDIYTYRSYVTLTICSAALMLAFIFCVFLSCFTVTDYDNDIILYYT